MIDIPERGAEGTAATQPVLQQDHILDAGDIVGEAFHQERRRPVADLREEGDVRELVGNHLLVVAGAARIGVHEHLRVDDDLAALPGLFSQLPRGAAGPFLPLSGEGLVDLVLAGVDLDLHFREPGVGDHRFEPRQGRLGHAEHLPGSGALRCLEENDGALAFEHLDLAEVLEPGVALLAERRFAGVAGELPAVFAFDQEVSHALEVGKLREAAAQGVGRRDLGGHRAGSGLALADEAQVILVEGDILQPVKALQFLGGEGRVALVEDAGEPVPVLVHQGFGVDIERLLDAVAVACGAVTGGASTGGRGPVDVGGRFAEATRKQGGGK